VCICYEARKRDREEVWVSNAIWEFTSVVVSRTLKLRALSGAAAVFLPTRPVELPLAGCRRASGRLKWSWGWHLRKGVALTVGIVILPVEKRPVHKFPQDY